MLRIWVPSAAPQCPLRPTLGVFVSSPSSAASATTARFKPWETVIAWLAVALAIAGVLQPAFMLLSQWDYMMYVLRGETVLFFGMALPLIFLAGSVLLLLKSKYSFVVLCSHFVLSCCFMAYRNGLANMPPFLYLNYLFEVGLIYVSYSLWCRNALR